MHNNDTQDTLIAANVQLSRQLRRAYDAARAREGLRVWESPDVISRDAWLSRVWREYTGRDPLDAPLLLTSLQTEMLWEKAIRTSEHAASLLDLRATVSTAAHAWDLLQTWEAPFDSADILPATDPAAFAGWKRTVERQLRENGWIVKSQLPRAVGKKVLAGELEIPSPIAYVGFHDLAPADRRIFEACGATERPVPESFASPLRSRVACESTADELMRAAAWARRKLEQNPGGRFGIAVRGLSEHTALVERIFDDILHPGVVLTEITARRAFCVSASKPALDHPLIGSALLALGLHSGLPVTDAGVLFCSPFLSLNRLAGAKLAAQLRRHGMERVSLEMETVRETFPKFCQAAETLSGRQLPSQWSSAFSRLLQLAGWPGKRELTSVEYQTLEDWRTSLSDLASLDLVLPRLDYGDALGRLRQIARARRATAIDEAAPVQVIDIRETAGTRWDGLWLAGLDASAWPQPARPNPFLPLSLQRAASMPRSSPERELAEARQVTADLLSAAPEVVCSFARSSGDERLRVSPLIEGLPEETSATPPARTALQQVFEAVTPMEMQLPDQAPPLPPGTAQLGGMSLLKNQADCPFRAFAIHRLNARGPDEADLGISPSERGTVAHKALESIWRTLKSRSDLLNCGVEQLRVLIASSVSDALEEKLGRRHPSGALDRARELEQARWERLIARWLDQEKARADFAVFALETKQDVEVGGLKLQVKADRIDDLKDGTFAILDYKTSDLFSEKDWDGERPEAPQLPLYAVKSGLSVSGVHFAKLSLANVRLAGYGAQELPQHLERWKQVVENLGASFLRGDAAVDPKQAPQTCAFCQLKSLCRVGELSGGAGADEVGAEDEA